MHKGIWCVKAFGSSMMHEGMRHIAQSQSYSIDIKGIGQLSYIMVLHAIYHAKRMRSQLLNYDTCTKRRPPSLAILHILRSESRMAATLWTCL